MAASAIWTIRLRDACTQTNIFAVGESAEVDVVETTLLQSQLIGFGRHKLFESINISHSKNEIADYPQPSLFILNMNIRILLLL